MAEHVVARLTVEVAGGEAGAARALAERASAAAPLLSAVLARRLDALDNDRRYRLDRLSLTLPPCDPAAFEDSLAARLDAALAEALPGELARADACDPAEDGLECVATLARTGLLPWWAAAGGPVLARAAAALADDDRPALAAQLRSLLRRPEACARLARHLPPAALARIAARMAGAPAEALAALAGSYGRSTGREVWSAMLSVAAAGDASIALGDLAREVARRLSLRSDPAPGDLPNNIPAGARVAAPGDRTEAPPTPISPNSGAEQRPGAPALPPASIGSDEHGPDVPRPRPSASFGREDRSDRPGPVLAVAGSEEREDDPAETSIAAEASFPRRQRRSSATIDRAEDDAAPPAGRISDAPEPSPAATWDDSLSSDGADGGSLPPAAVSAAWRVPQSSTLAALPDSSPSSSTNRRSPPASEPSPPLASAADELDSESLTPEHARPDPTPTRQPAAAERRPASPLATLAHDAIPLETAGVALLWPFLPDYFAVSGLVDAERRFRSPAARHRAAALLDHLATGDRDPPEYRLPLAKLLVGLPLDVLHEPGPPITDEEAGEAEALLDAVLGHLAAFGRMSVAGFRDSWLCRPGLLGVEPGHYAVRVERRAWDVLLDRLPWQIGWLRLPWMEAMVRVEW